MKTNNFDLRDSFAKRILSLSSDNIREIVLGIHDAMEDSKKLRETDIRYLEVFYNATSEKYVIVMVAEYMCNPVIVEYETEYITNPESVVNNVINNLYYEIDGVIYNAKPEAMINKDKAVDGLREKARAEMEAPEDVRAARPRARNLGQAPPGDIPVEDIPNNQFNGAGIAVDNGVVADNDGAGVVWINPANNWNINNNDLRIDIVNRENGLFIEGVDRPAEEVHREVPRDNQDQA